MGPTTRTVRPQPAPLERPAFYALRPGGWRDLVTVLHAPYTAWNLSNVAIGASLAPHLYVGRLLAALAAFFLAVGVSAHVLDELHGRPLGTTLSSRFLIALAIVSLAGAAAIGAVVAVTVSLTLIPFIVAGVFIVLAYNLEWFGGRFHTTFWLAMSWGVFPVVTSYWINALEIRPGPLLAAAGCGLLLVAQRTLSTPVRELRRRTVAVTGEQRLTDGSTVSLDAAMLAAPMERALQACALAMVLLATGLVLTRV
ncbi:MAG TPA: hypothetical protein VGG41_14970 [Solirubrobacteraceae bacterium]|jgi:hypothetical protein